MLIQSDCRHSVAMSANHPLIQIQFSLDNTVFKGVELLQSLIKAASEDDVHAQVVMAFEALGSALLVSPERIGEGIDALSQSQQHKLSIGRKLKAIVGLNGDGIALIIRKKATQCVPAFLLVTSCKICFDDIEIGNILYEMLLQFGIMRTFPASRIQMGQLVTSISGYGDSIIPMEALETITGAIHRASGGSPTSVKLFWHADTKSVAEIFARTFGALPKEDVKRITLQGEVGGAFIASIFLWLLPNEFSLSLEGVPTLGRPDGKVILDLKSQDADRWVIQEWMAQNMLTEIIVETENLFGPETSLVNFTGATLGLRVISTQFELDNDHIETVGQLASALVMASYKHGVLSPDPETCAGFQQTVRLSELCQTGFLGNLPLCMAAFGWKCNKEFQTRAQRLSNAMDEWISSSCPSVVEPDPTTYPHIPKSPELYLYWVFMNLEAWMKTCPGYSNIRLGYRENVFDPAIFLAVEALYSCICEVLPSYRNLRGCTSHTLHTNAATLVALVFVPAQVKYTPKSPGKRVVSNLSMLNVSEFRRLAITSLLPGSPGNVEKRDLVFSFNGYVAFASPLKKITTIPRECVAISIVPGVIRWGEDNAIFDKIRETRAFLSPNETSENTPVEVFDQERTQYIGLQPMTDTSSLETESLISTSGKILLVRTYMHTLQGQNRRAVEVDWLSSINAVAVSTQVDEQDLPPAVEEALAKMWQKEYVWDRMIWVPAHGCITAARYRTAPSSPVQTHNFLSMTYRNERQRFFLAGRCKSIKIYMRQGGTPLIQCVRVALDAGREEHRKLSINQKSVADPPAAKGEQSKATTTLKLPSDITKSEAVVRNWIVIS